jgi:hypothetical protein
VRRLYRCFGSGRDNQYPGGDDYEAVAVCWKDHVLKHTESFAIEGVPFFSLMGFSVCVGLEREETADSEESA